MGIRWAFVCLCVCGRAPLRDGMLCFSVRMCASMP